MGDRRQATGTIPSVGLFGCGRIGSALDEGNSEHVLTHASAIGREAGVQLAAICDPDPERLASAGRARGVSALYTDPEALFAHEAVDIVVIATPTELRTSLIEQALDAGVRTFVLEKPIAANLAEAEAIAARLKAASATVAVNYLRRYASGLQALAQRLRSGAFGALNYANVHYGKGINNNGSHAIDLMRWWFGDPESVTVTGRVEDGRKDDPTLHVVYHLAKDMGHAPVTFQASDHRALSLFEIDLVCTKGRVRITERGAHLRVSTVAPDPTFPGYAALGAEEVTEGGVHHALAGLWRDLAEVFKGTKGAPRCTLDDGLAAMRIVEATRTAEARCETVQIQPATVR